MAGRIALVRAPSTRMHEGLVTYGERCRADPGLAASQHEAYVRALAESGWEIREVGPADEAPDSAFVEDTVVVCGELAVLARSGAPERRVEVAGAEEAVRQLGLDVERIDEPGTLDGGDVLRVGTTLYVGRGGRTNAEGIRQLAALAEPRGFTVVAVALNHVLHLKSAITALPDGTVVVADPPAIDTAPLPPLRTVPEEAGSHVVPIGGRKILMAASAPRSAELFAGWGFEPVVVDIGEFEKLEGCVTCLSVMIEARHACCSVRRSAPRVCCTPSGGSIGAERP